ncbi:N-6 DNA methylase [Aeromonas caviae]|uniref:site-specific DNA-methyltransferase (adenine-specific) n=1 Tax=Aeromonas caviae TaxID=648 RepID=A0AAV4YQP4_AERCA|nr:N-6 DNA methylase [Aeromonas caviae]MEA9437510.1 N-6 DNA methylase [Aeromonas caviae]GJA34396.1 type I restriction-modification system subunit M [Aeromonas caviae]GJA38824.1 type I restriction-modification system subunit M [Aeromonas caviae]GJA43384.1 type I restriction-modification system subunit M [Aeromonas caviae]GJA51994.1 type I restriction-modification system subunit M [Aeromonas caviae]
MAIKKNELYSSLWASCDELRGGMDASQYKDYVLTLLFVKYVSDKAKGNPYAMIEVPGGASFDDMVALKGSKEIGEGINRIISALAVANDLQGIITIADFNDEDKLGKGKEMTDRLSKLVAIFEGLDLSANRTEGDDLLGDAYEYLMRHFATESGKSKGQFYTPAEVSRILAKVIGISRQTPQDATVYDPTCGSGSLLLKASDEAGPKGLSIYGQEMDNATQALARMNMILHDNPTAKVWKGNTLADPQWKEANGALKTFDFAVANPPFSNKNWTSGLDAEHDPFDRFNWGVPPEKNGDYAFLLHIIKSLKSTGKGAVILPHGVLFRGNAEARIRENLLKQGYIKGIIGLPANLFYGTGIPACIIVIDKEHAQARAFNPTGASSEQQRILMVDASRGFIKDGNKNRLREQDIHLIVDTFTRGLTLDGYSRWVPLAEIAANDYNLNIPRYIDGSDGEDLHDLAAHLQGGIPERDIEALGSYWQIFPTLKTTLFAPLRPGYSQAQVPAAKVRGTILAHDEFTRFKQAALAPFSDWFAACQLPEFAKGDSPKALIEEISEALLEAYRSAGLGELLDPYAIYQLLMDYWQSQLQDDLYVLSQDGWEAGRVLRELKVEKGEKQKESADLVIGKAKFKAELIPPALLVARFFSKQQQALDKLQTALDEASQALESFIEEQSGEEGGLVEALNDKEKVTAASVKARLKLATDREEKEALKQAQTLFDTEASAKKAHKEASDALDKAVFARYPKLDDAEIKTLLVEDKWQASLYAALEAEIERVTQQLATRVKELEERYSSSLPQLTKSVSELEAKVATHLKAMGLEWAL